MTSSTARTISSTLCPVPVPTLNCSDAPPFSRYSTRQNVRLRQVVHVDVVADAGAVRVSIIVAEERDGLAGLHGAEQQRNQVGLGFVLLAEAALGIGAARR